MKQEFKLILLHYKREKIDLCLSDQPKTHIDRTHLRLTACSMNEIVNTSTSAAEVFSDVSRSPGLVADTTFGSQLNISTKWTDSHEMLN